VTDSGAARAEPSLLELCQVATESYVMKSVFTRGTNLIRTTKDVFWLGRASPADCADGDVHNPSEDGLGAYPGRGCLEKRIFPLLRVAARGE